MLKSSAKFKTNEMSFLHVISIMFYMIFKQFIPDFPGLKYVFHASVSQNIW